MFSRYRFYNWRNNTPANIIEYMLSPCPLGLRILNFIFQKIFRINGEVNFMVHYTSQVIGNIHLGRNVASSFANSGGCYIQGINGIKIGDNTIFAPGVKIISANHSKEDLDKHERIHPVTIGNNCWLGANAVVLPGIAIGNNVIVGAGSVVTKNFGDNLIIGGIPAKVLRENL